MQSYFDDDEKETKIILPAKTWEELKDRYFSKDENKTLLNLLKDSQGIEPRDFLLSDLVADKYLKKGTKDKELSNLQRASIEEIKLTQNYHSTGSGDEKKNGWFPVSTMEQVLSRYPNIQTSISYLGNVGKSFETLNAWYEVESDPDSSRDTFKNTKLKTRFIIKQALKNEEALKTWVRLTDGRSWTPEQWSSKLAWIMQLPTFKREEGKVLSVHQNVILRKLQKLDSEIRPVYYYYVGSVPTSSDNYDDDNYYDNYYDERCPHCLKIHF